MAESPVNLIASDDRDSDIIRSIAESLADKDEKTLSILDEERNVKIQLPYALYRVLTDAAHLLANGDSVGLLHYTKDVTTQQAAGILQVSRPYVVKLLEDREIPYYMVGSHRRIKLKDVLEYKQRRDSHRKEKLDELYRISNESGLYDIDGFPQEHEDEE